eukprot:CAMPEP_0117435704 /NCGR_PEP_ID=MMETSP0759-20121206/620_1 /TAXON_ID=63605 /ORGANISM="Percolomonas cosmopolitus, Strain WS" /LENGTH=783 /DNA_ID=CAMNT_0005227263 /DNA_START=216 /DNA_END=2567 /DNA_ORIENTATION=-
MPLHDSSSSSQLLLSHQFDLIEQNIVHLSNVFAELSHEEVQLLSGDQKKDDDHKEENSVCDVIEEEHNMQHDESMLKLRGQGNNGSVEFVSNHSKTSSPLKQISAALVALTTSTTAATEDDKENVSSIVENVVQQLISVNEPKKSSPQRLVTPQQQQILPRSPEMNIATTREETSTDSLSSSPVLAPLDIDRICSENNRFGQIQMPLNETPIAHASTIATPLEVILETCDNYRDLRVSELIHEDNLRKIIQYAVGRPKNIEEMISEGTPQEMETIIGEKWFEKQQDETSWQLDDEETAFSMLTDYPQHIYLLHHKIAFQYPTMCTQLLTEAKHARVLLKSIANSKPHLKLLFELPLEGSDNTSTPPSLEQASQFCYIFKYAAERVTPRVALEFQLQMLQVAPRVLQSKETFVLLLEPLLSAMSREIPANQQQSNTLFQLKQTCLSNVVALFERIQQDAQDDTTMAFLTFFYALAPPASQEELQFYPNSRPVSPIVQHFLKSEACARAFVDHLVASARDEARFEHCIIFLERYLMHTEVLDAFFEILPRLTSMLREAPTEGDANITTRSTKEITSPLPRVGLIRLSVANLLVVLVARLSKHATPEQQHQLGSKMLESCVLDALINLFFEFPLCNILHCKFVRCFMDCATLTEPDLMSYAIQKCNLMRRIVDAILDPGRKYKTMEGALFQLFNLIVEEAKLREDDWQKYCCRLNGYETVLQKNHHRYLVEKVFVLGEGMTLPTGLHSDDEADDESTEEENTEESVSFEADNLDDFEDHDDDVVLE